MAAYQLYAKLSCHFSIAPLRLIYQVKEKTRQGFLRNHSFSVKENLHRNFIVCILIINFAKTPSNPLTPILWNGSGKSPFSPCRAPRTPHGAPLFLGPRSPTAPSGLNRSLRGDTLVGVKGSRLPFGYASGTARAPYLALCFALALVPKELLLIPPLDLKVALEHATIN